jgi:DNA-directed RNA polymerase subunit beta
LKKYTRRTKRIAEVLISKLQVLLKDHSSTGVNNNFGEVQIGKGAKFTQKT